MTTASAALEAALISAVEYVVAAFAGLWAYLKDLFAWIESKLGIVDKVSGAIDAVKSKAGNIADSIKGGANRALSLFGGDDVMTSPANMVSGTALAGGNTQNHIETSNNINMTINATSSDPAAVGAAAKNGTAAALASNLARNAGTPVPIS